MKWAILVACASAAAGCSEHHQTKPAVDLTSAKSLDDAYDLKARIKCDDGADDFLRTAAKYDFRWDKSTEGMFGVKFGQFRAAVPSPGVLTMVSNNLEMQNGFGAYQRVEISCAYNTQTDAAPTYALADGTE